MLQQAIDWLVYYLFRLNPSSRLVRALDFFIYDSVKIMLLLFVMIFVIGFLRTFLPQDKIKKWLGGKGIIANFLASLFGAITPFCSCSSIPLFISFLKTGIPLGVTFSFLVTSPMINEYLVVLMLGFFGWKITLGYIISGMFIGMISGLVLGKMKLERFIEEDMAETKGEISACAVKPKNIKQRLIFGLNEAVCIVKKFWVWILFGVALGAAIHNYIPDQAVHSIVSKTGFFSVPIAVLIGIPMYGSCAAIVPIALVLFQKGFPLGTALAFMMAVSALSFPEAVMLRRAMKLKLIIIFFGITSLGIIFTGYLFNLLQKLLI